MAFTMDGIVFDRITQVIAEDFEGNVLYVLSQLKDAKIDISVEAKESKDKDGVLIKKFYNGKSGTFSANSALVDFNIMAAQSGTAKQLASSGTKIIMPAIKTVKKGTKTITLKGVKDGTVHVEGLAGNGTKTKTYTKDVQASATAFSISAETLTLPTDDANNDVQEYLVRYDRDVESGVKVLNKADEYPRTVRLLLKGLAIEPCSADTLREVYVKLPSFQPSPETSLALQTDAELEFKGDLQVDYCSPDKTLYEIYMAEEDIA